MQQSTHNQESRAITEPLLMQEHADALLKFMATTLVPEFGLSTAETSKLLGGMPRSTLRRKINRAVAGEDIKLSIDQLDRLYLLEGIYKAIKKIAKDDEQALQRIFLAPNQLPLFEGLSTKAYLLSKGTMLALYTTLRHYENQMAN
jgi:hypothetical protein